MQLHNFEDLVQFLKDYRSWGNQSEGYDADGMLHLLAACLDNLRQNATKSDLADLPECLEAHHIMFLKKLATGL
jgi:hypothetical protein